MSNPAVIKLQSGHINKSKVWLDDNFGESIHVHIDDIRVDLTVNEFRQLYEDVCIALTSLINVDNLNIREIDPVFLSVMLRPYLPKLKKVSFDKVRLNDLLAPYHDYIYRLSESVGVKALKGISNEGDGSRKSNHIGQSEKERMQVVLDSIKANGYPFKNNYIILFGDDNVIRDGQHRASCLYFLYGDIEIPVMRLYFDDYKTPNIGKNRNNRIRLFFVKRSLYLHSAIRVSNKMAKKVLSKVARKIKCIFKKRRKLTTEKEVVAVFRTK